MKLENKLIRISKLIENCLEDPLLKDADYQPTFLGLVKAELKQKMFELWTITSMLYRYRYPDPDPDPDDVQSESKEKENIGFEYCSHIDEFNKLLRIK